MPLSPWRTFLKALTADPAVVESIQNRSANFIQPLGGTNVSQGMRAAIQRAQAATYAWMYANQPAVRTVVDYIATNTAQLGLKVYDRVSDTERESANDHPAALTMRYPNEATPQDLFIAEYVSDYLVYNNAYAWKVRRGPGNPMTVIRLLPHMVAVLGQGYAVTGYRVFRTDGSFRDLPPDEIIHWRNYNPEDPRLGISPLETLRAELVQESATMAVLTELATNGLQGGYISRPMEVDPLSVEAEERFMEAWANHRKNSPRKTPLLQEGMQFVQQMMSPKDAELLASREFTRDEVAGQYGMEHCPPQDEEERKQFLADVLAPLSKRLSSQLDLSILQMEFMRTDLYFEFNMDEKMRGDIESRLPNLVSAAGAPIMLRDEARAILNLPKVDGGDELVTPMNVIVGDNPKPAPNVMGPQDPNGNPQDGSYRELPPGQQSLNGHNKAAHLIPRRAALSVRRNEDATLYARIYRSHFDRQQATAAGKNGSSAKAVDDQRWNEELSRDLLAASQATVKREGAVAAARMAWEFDPSRTEGWLESRAIDIAGKVNAYTAQRIAEVGFSDAFAEAKQTRAVQTGMSDATQLFAFSAKEALEQVPDRQNRMITVSGGECEVCAPFQGSFRPDEIEGYPPYHTNCNCIAEAG